ncbi:SDR family NAD(P)-dependent oxidoreductase [Sphingobium sp. EM0848]|uniref:SDR family NAD(P)-dependent oxidoreductase n=1 Tax=Sphingobium sp. EM0848 TaxID=2743473 RepID=UPI00159C3D10|nr:SDR family oxidoreductase [Sphingobium sp. EM0848]
MTDLNNRCYIVTGAASGLGRAMTMGLLDAGACVIAGDLQQEAFDPIPASTGKRCRTILLDVRKTEDSERAVACALDAFGRLDGIINNAGIGQERIRADYIVNPPPFWSVPPALWRQIIEVNTIGPFNLAHAATPVMLRSGHGRIINVTTSLSTMLARGMAPYGGSKAATEAHTAIMAQDLDGTGITVNALVPGGPVNTPMVPAESGFERQALLQPEVMLPPLLWLLSPAADKVTGRRLVAALWDTSRKAEEAAALAGAPAGWPIPEHGQAILPHSFR